MKKLIALSLLLLSSASMILRAQTNEPLVSAVAVLTIHVSDTNIHDIVFQFLTNVLKLPVEYGPEVLGDRRYAAVYAGNMFIEPCGPFSNMSYTTKDFKALFFGLNCVSAQSTEAVAAHLDHLGLTYEKTGEKQFRIQDASVAEGIYLAIDTQPPDKRAQEQENSFRSALEATHRDGLGFEYVSEICLGYRDPGCLRAWENLLGPACKVNDTCWRLSRNQTVRFVKSEIQGVRGIRCRVRSIEKALQYLEKAKCPGRLADGTIELDKAKTCGLAITFSEQ